MRDAHTALPYEMAAKRITVSLPPEVAARIERAVGRGSVSEWMTKAALQALEADHARARLLEWCATIPTTPEDEQWAQDVYERIVGRPPKSAKRKAERRKKVA